MDNKIETYVSYDFAFGRVRDVIADALDCEQTKAAFLLLDFEKIHGGNGVMNMFGFLRYMAAKYGKMPEIKRQNAITSTIIHDINGRAERCMVPRTDGYLTYVNT